MTNVDVDLLLINPINRKKLPAYPPIGLISIATYLQENGFSCKILDRNIERGNIAETLKKYNPRAVGVSFFATGPLIIDGINIIRTLRQVMGKEIPIICGGLYPTLFPEHVIKDKDINFVIVSDGEITLLELMKNIDKPVNYRGIKGLVYKEHNGRIVSNPLREVIKNLDDLPMPDWDLIDIPKYLDSRFYGKKVISMTSSRGCPFRCSYCVEPILRKMGIVTVSWRGRSAIKMIEEIEFMKSKYKIDGVNFLDVNFDANKRRLTEFCHMLKREKIDIRWEHASRVDYAKKETLLMEKQRGCSVIQYGVETGSPRIIKFLRKDTSNSQVVQAFNNCNEVGIQAVALFMIGLPTETVEDLKMTIDLIKSVPHFYAIPTIYKPYSGSDLFDYCVNRGLIKVPENMEDLTKAYYLYSVDSPEPNVSEIPTDIIFNVWNYFRMYNVKREAYDAIRHFDVPRIFSGLSKMKQEGSLFKILKWFITNNMLKRGPGSSHKVV